MTLIRAEPFYGLDSATQNSTSSERRDAIAGIRRVHLEADALELREQVFTHEGWHV
jgi:hypothetical protein